MQIEQQRQHFSATLALSPKQPNLSRAGPRSHPSMLHPTLRSRRLAHLQRQLREPRASPLRSPRLRPSSTAPHSCRSTRPRSEPRSAKSSVARQSSVCHAGTYLCRYTWIYWLLYIDQYLQAFHLSEAGDLLYFTSTTNLSFRPKRSEVENLH